MSLKHLPSLLLLENIYDTFFEKYPCQHGTKSSTNKHIEIS